MHMAGTENRVIEGRSSRVVEEKDCASRWGNEDLHVLSTPAILGTMEQVCVDVLAPTLEAGEMTVGVSVQMSHLAPTPLGDTVAYDVVVARRGRHINVEFVVTDSRGTVISKGHHERALINKDKFLNRLAGR
jgi:fluoroacetyl-CoA thioesterase